MAPILNGLVIYRFINNNNNNNNNKSSTRVLNSRECKYKRVLLIFLTFIIIITALIICTFNVYGSPRIVVGNWQVSEFTLTGTEWFIKYSDKNIITATDGVDIKRFEDLVLGRGFSYTNMVKLDREPIPSHFGYNRNISISEMS